MSAIFQPSDSPTASNKALTCFASVTCSFDNPSVKSSSSSALSIDSSGSSTCCNFLSSGTSSSWPLPVMILSALSPSAPSISIAGSSISSILSSAGLSKIGSSRLSTSVAPSELP